MKIIKGFIKEMIGFIFRFSGLSILIRELFCRNKVTIIFYHNPVPYIFKKHTEYLSKHFNYIPLNRLVNAISNKDRSNIPPKALVISIDDGHKDNYKLLDLFKTYHIYPTIYLCSHIVNTNKKFWFKKAVDNRRRDLRKNRSLRKDGWQIITIWQCRLRTPDRVLKRLQTALS